MSTFEVLVRTVDDIYDHPNADRLSIVKVLGYEAITAKNEDGSHRFTKGEPIVYVPEGAVIPAAVLKEQGFWDEAKDKGMLAGRDGDRVKAVRLRSIISQGLVWKLAPPGRYGRPVYAATRDAPDGKALMILDVAVGDDVSDFFGITKYEPPVPAGMGGEVASVFDFQFTYDIENAQNYPGFLDGDIIEAAEKIHGTCFRVSYRPNVAHAEMFGKGGVAVASKGLGSKGFVFKNNEANAGNLYVRTAVGLGLIEAVEQMGETLDQSIDLFGEIFGQGVQDLHYGMSKPAFRAFDIAIGGKFADASAKAAAFEKLGVERVPVLYTGPWDAEALTALRDGKSTLFDHPGEKPIKAHIREGIVVTAVGDQTKRDTGRGTLRPILKMVSPDYLTRKGDVTEHQ